MAPTMKFPWGATVTDVISGFTGIVGGFSTYITGCDRYLLEPTDSKIESKWFDADRLKQLDADIVVLPGKTSNGAGREADRR